MRPQPHHRAVAARLAAEADIHLTPACVETVERYLREARLAEAKVLDLASYRINTGDDRHD